MTVVSPVVTHPIPGLPVALAVTLWGSSARRAGRSGLAFPEDVPHKGLVIGWLRTGALLFPVLVATWVVPGFTTQDGPAHVYNAWILADSFSIRPAYGPYFEVRWQPLTNWAGHLALAGLFRIVSPWTADRILMSVTLAR